MQRARIVIACIAALASVAFTAAAGLVIIDSVKSHSSIGSPPSAEIPAVATEPVMVSVMR